MPFYEVIYEPGTHSIAQYDSDEEALSAVKAHHDKATSGEPGGPTGHAAERVVKVLKYEQHPADENMAQTIDAKEALNVLKEKVDALAVGGLVSVPELASAIRDTTTPLVASGPHESNYAAKEVTELTLPWAGGK